MIAAPPTHVCDELCFLFVELLVELFSVVFFSLAARECRDVNTSSYYNVV